MYYYLYRTTNILNNKIYIGVHKTNNLDDDYFGSGKILKRAIKKYKLHNFKKEIIEYFDDEVSMYTKEKEIVDDSFVMRHDTYNLIPGGLGGWHCKPNNEGKVICLDADNIIRVSQNEFINSDNLKGINKDKVTCKNLINDKIHHVTKKEFDENEFLVGINHGIVDSDETKKRKSLSSKGKFTAFDTIQKKFVYVTIDEYKKNDNIITTYKKRKLDGIEIKRNVGKDHHMTKTVKIFDKNGKLMHNINGSFGEFCKDNNLPGYALAESYKNNGKPIYSKNRSQDLKKLKNKGFDIYIGWYAIKEK